MTGKEEAPTLALVNAVRDAYIRDNSKTIRDLIKQGIAGFGENIVVRRFMRFELGG